MRRRSGTRLAVVLALLAGLQFVLRPFLGDPRVAPDFLVLALLVYAIRSRPGGGAAAGFAVGILLDAMQPAAFGANALAHTVVGYLAAWGKAVFFADNVIVNAGVFFAGVWVRNVIVILASGQGAAGASLWHLLLWSPLMGLTTALAGVLVLLLVGRWLEPHLAES